jgi:transposase-like protein
MTCQYCNGNCRKAGKQTNGAQKLYCKACKKNQQSSYHKKAYGTGINVLIPKLLYESVGIRGIGRILHIAASTVIRRIKKFAAALIKPASTMDRPCLEVDELWTFMAHELNYLIKAVENIENMANFNLERYLMAGSIYDFTNETSGDKLYSVLGEPSEVEDYGKKGKILHYENLRFNGPGKLCGL